MSRFEQWVEANVFSGLDEALARALLRRFSAEVVDPIDGDERDLQALGVALASRAVQRGHVCADLALLVSEPLLDPADQVVEGIEWPDVEAWCAALRRAPFVANLATGSDLAPLRLDGTRLYLSRYADYELRIAGSLLAMAKGPSPAASVVPAGPRPTDQLRERLASLFDRSAATSVSPVRADGTIAAGADRQQLAAAVACSRRLTVVSGGPGTGKTTTVVKLLLLLIEQRLAAGQAPTVLLLAPTGKAAQRLTESIRGSGALAEARDEVRSCFSGEAMTVHRALGFQPQTPSRFRHHAERPLTADLVVVDEASMIDVAMFAKLLDALAPMAQLVLLGDRNQLASVEAGAIYGDICRAGEGGYSPEFRARLRQLFEPDAAVGLGARLEGADGVASPDVASSGSAISDCVVELTRSYRYAQDSGIAALAQAIQRGDAAAMFDVMASGCDDVEWAGRDASPAVIQRDLIGRIVRGAKLDGESGMAGMPEQRLQWLEDFRVLAAHRRGRLGVEEINRLMEANQRGSSAAGDLPYAGRPVMVTRNDYALGLWNGDVGVLAAAPGDSSESLAAWFPGADPQVPRRFAISRLPDHEVVHAMTIHKSQGSEFGEVVVVLPEAVSPILTRELVYTAVTRAKRKVVIYAAEQVLRRAIARRIDRASGLYERLTGN